MSGDRNGRVPRRYFLLREGSKLIRYWGPQQMGGIYDSQLATSAVVLICELRPEAGLQTWRNFADVHYGFDVTNCNEIRWGNLQAGIVGKSWLLQDDILKQNVVRVALLGFVSEWMQLDGGIGQGKKASVYNYNTAAKELYDLLDSVPAAVAAPMDLFPQTLLEKASILEPVSSDDFQPRVVNNIFRLFGEPEIKDASALDFLCSLDSPAELLFGLDLLLQVRLTAVQYLDDGLPPGSSDCHSCEIWGGV